MKAKPAPRIASLFAVVALAFPGCGGSQPPIAAPYARSIGVPQQRGTSARYRVLFDFGTPSGGCADGALPASGLVPVNGLLYGTTFGGGANNGGTVFSVDKKGAERIVYNFDLYRGNANGPVSDLVATNGRLYGTLPKGGTYDGGLLFSIDEAGRENVLYSFGNGADGSTPQASLTVVNGVLYGTTSEGGAYGYGTVFSVNIKTGKERVLHSFGGQPDGREPQSDLLALNGMLYGTTAYGGAGDFGSVFSVGPKGKERVIYSFGNSPDGLDPQAGLIAANGRLYGTTAWGGAYEGGTVFGVSTSGADERVLHSFSNNPDGQDPRADLILVKGTLYGTTTEGGAYGGYNFGGTLYSVRANTGKERVLHSFGNGTDGQYPVAPVAAINGALFGTTLVGGSNFSWCVTSGGNTLGTIFKWRL